MNTQTRPALASIWRIGLLGSLYLSQGLPFGFFTQGLPVLLRKEGFSLGQIGLSSLLALPWALKFVWAPVVDRYSMARFGKRKSWIVPLQFGSVAILAVLGSSSAAANSITALMGAVLLLNLLAATQDIATDGLAVDTLPPSERGLANGVQVAAYRIGMIAGGGVLLTLHDRLGSSRTFLAMAVLTVLATVPITVTREPRPVPVDGKQLRGSTHFLRRPGAARVLLLLIVYKAGDAFATGMLRPFLADAGLSLAEIGWLLGTVGFVAGLLGALSGGALVNRLGRKSALVLFGLLQAAAVMGYAYLAIGAPGLATLYAVCAAEHFAGGMATAALFTCMMDWCSQEASATDYTVQASAVVIATGTASALAGFSAQTFGYFGHFCLATALALGAIAAVRRCFPTAEATPSIRSQARKVASCA
jgi:MFS transporter, PAT family, beta-lactamase induction signal transducer AmpG